MKKVNNKDYDKFNKKDNKIAVSESKIIVLKSFKVAKESELLTFLLTHLNDSRNNIKHLLANHQVLVNGSSITQFNFMLAKEDLITISKNPVLKEKKSKIKLDIIYEDDELIVINKPSGLLSMESDNEKSNTAYRLVMDYVTSKNPKARIYLVHRIDRDTSGVLLFSKDEKLRDLLQHRWQDIVSKREYIAICEGVFKEKNGTIKSYLRENVNHLMYSTNDHSGQLAITHYHVLKDNGKYSLVDVNIDSGRKNQIRVHMLDLGHKVVGDDKYGPVSNPINRLGLHAYSLAFTHPTSKKKLEFTAKTPAIFDNLFKK